MSDTCGIDRRSPQPLSRLGLGLHSSGSQRSRCAATLGWRTKRLRRREKTEPNDFFQITLDPPLTGGLTMPPRLGVPAAALCRNSVTILRCCRVHHRRVLEDHRPDSQDAPVLSRGDRKSTRLNSSHLVISYAVFCLKKKTDK